ncbi:hypothetical protein [Sphingobium aromaticiconvertens]|uniref:hypothetical protein n=1 Tax=Sphingobium aromaticiconvertens TaxID=365341 RepID=UPI00301AC625
MTASEAGRLDSPETDHTARPKVWRGRPDHIPDRLEGDADASRITINEELLAA